MGKRAAALAALVVLAVCGGCARHDALPGFPRVFVWAWERPEDLSTLDPRVAGVAFLARTVHLEDAGVRVEPRFQPLRVAPGTVLMAVVRIESDHRAPAPPAVAADRILPAAGMPGVRALQVDFDAVASERGWYRLLLAELRSRLPSAMPLTMTALASWCGFDNWLTGLPVAEAVPMLFRMGAQPWRPGDPLDARPCRDSLGISTDEPFEKVPRGRRVYIFHPRAWSPADLRAALREAGRWL